MRLKGFVGPAYTLDHLAVEAQRCINLYPEMIETGTGRDGEIAYLKSHPGLRSVLTVGNGPIRNLHIDPLGQVFAVSGSAMHKLSYSGSSWSSSSLGSLNTSTGTVTADSNLINSTDTVSVFVDGTDSYTFEDIASAESFDDYDGRGYSQVDGATHVVFLDGFWIFNKPDSNQFFSSTWGDFNVDPLDFASAEGDPDKIKAIIKNNRELWLFGDRTAEIFVNTGNADFPFERASGAVIQKGIAAPYSLAEIEGVVFWLGRDKSGHGIVYAAAGLQAQRISTHAIEKAIAGYEIDSISTADAFTYSHNGHSFYQLNFPEASWVYDLNTKLWHEKAYNNLGTLERDRANYHVFVPELGVHLFGDYESNVIYELDASIFKHGSVPMRRIRTGPHSYAEGKRLFYGSFEADVEKGVGLDGGVQGSDPQAILKHSNDGGYTWSNESWQSMGALGNRRSRVKWNRLGSGRDRIYWLEVADPVDVTILGAEIEAEAGVS